MMHDGKGLQGGTTHFFGDGFARAFDIRYADKNNTLQYVHQSSWGVTTRMIGAIIMVHGDDSGLKLPPAVAPVQVAVLPIANHKPGVSEAASELTARLCRAGLRAKLDDGDQSPGWKFAEHEMRGVPLRIEIGPKDIEKGQCVLVRRDNREKAFVSLDNVPDTAREMLESIQACLFTSAKALRDSRLHDVLTLDDLVSASEKPGFVRSMWCGSAACEELVRAKTGMKSRCLPFDQTPIGQNCPLCGGQGKHLLYWGQQY
jgi:prolyl-tRNA synthetase